MRGVSRAAAGVRELGDDRRANGLRDVEQAIAANYDRLTTGQRLVIDRLFADTRYGAVVTAPRLAREIGVSESTVTRAAQALGFAGFPDLQGRLRAAFVEPVHDRIGGETAGVAGSAHAAIQVMREDAASIEATADDLSIEAFDATVDALVSARRVLIFGERGSHGLVVILGVGLRLLLPDARVLNQAAGDLPDQLLGLNRSDVVVAVSFRRVDRMTLKVLKRARTMGARAIAVTDHLSSPAARASDLSLIVRLADPRLMPSFAPGASIINALLSEIAIRTHHHVSPRLREAEELWDEFEAYATT